ncbi:glycosyltransferase family 4 protein [Agrococcus sp. SGAir0287]|uniref:glycosyltransferase family 4 protein n=1 Tax=Agrococcus sp. SGAir0287 TaxID=2070347 RepID=UPI0010CCCD7B|nr:glycosyltransferase family 4 protein [Agrococcus sp. SGAir0287]QCR19865.1 glycosyltransferase WbuB [Agrococcus sp. SGAir0287]
MTATASVAGAARRLRVLVVSQYYWPEPASIPTLLAEELQRRGHEVRVLTTFPNYPTGRLPEGQRQRAHVVETVRGVRVHRVPMLLDRSERTLRRAASYASFALSSALRGRLGMSADVVYVYATQMTPALGPALWRRRGGPPFVLHVQDLWPDSIVGASFVGSGAGHLIAGALEPLLRRAYAQASATIGISRPMAATLVERGAPRSRVHAVSNWAEERRSPALERPARRGRRSTSFLYAGNLGDAQRLDEVLRAAAMVDGDPRFSLDVYGTGTAEDRLRALATLLGLRSVRFHGRVGTDRMAEIYRDHDFQVVSLAETPALRTTVPSKLPTSLLHGVPVVAAVRGAAADIVAEHGAGVVAPTVDAEGIAAAFRVAMDLGDDERAAMSRRARSAYERSMSLAAGVDAIEAILHDVVREDVGRPGAMHRRASHPSGIGGRGSGRPAPREQARQR